MFWKNWENYIKFLWKALWTEFFPISFFPVLYNVHSRTQCLCNWNFKKIWEGGPAPQAPVTLRLWVYVRLCTSNVHNHYGKRKRESRPNKISQSNLFTLELGTRNTKTSCFVFHVSCFVYIDTNTRTLSRNTKQTRKKLIHEKHERLENLHLVLDF